MKNAKNKAIERKKEGGERVFAPTDRYKQNLHVGGDKIYSYGTHVGTLNHEKKILHAHGKFSPTTSKHVNYVARQHGYKVEYDKE